MKTLDSQSSREFDMQIFLTEFEPIKEAALDNRGYKCSEPILTADYQGRKCIRFVVPAKTYDVLIDREVVTRFADRIGELSGMSGFTSIAEVGSPRQYKVYIYLSEG